jgi:hypothetical protein
MRMVMRLLLFDALWMVEPLGTTVTDSMRP